MLSVMSGVWNRPRKSSEREMIPVSFSFFVCFSFLQKSFHYYSFFILFFFSWKLFYFFMFRYAPECSGMFRVPCFIDALSYCGAFEERSCLSGPPLKLIIMRKAWFPLSRNFYVRTCVKFTLANKIEALYEKSHVSVKVEPRSTSRLLSTLYILPLFYLLYLIKIFVR